MSSLISKSLSLFYFSFILFLSVHFPPTKAWTSCLGALNYSNGSSFGTNLNLLLSDLPSNASATGFAYQAIGQAPDRVYGLAQCRGDVTPDECRDCLNTAREEPLNACPKRSAITWYDVCLLRYSDRGIGSSSDNSPEIYVPNPNNISDPIRFSQLLSQMMHDLISNATSVSSGAPLYATNQTNFNSSQTIYGLVQCTKKLSRSDCRSCLEGAIAGILACCGGKQGGRVLGSNCFLWFENSKFYKDVGLSTAPSPPFPSLGPPTDISGALAPPLSAPTPPSLSPQKNETATGRNGSSSQITTIVVIAVPTGIGVALILAVAICFLRSRQSPVTDNQATDHGLERNELLQVDLEAVRVATDNFSEENKLGQGGFGAVYKGRLSNGQEIAVKRLFRNSGQGDQEFKNEVALVAKLQHRNLVRLLGSCVEGQETVVIYEYMPNSSLDNFLFNLSRRASLDWVKRYKIIWGIARGLLYLHEDSRLRIIHRDLKASNVLLDREMNPKISDFGLARIVGLDKTHITASRIAGTYGYMAPEYAVHGQFSVKSDVFSFGVLILEILTGRKNNTYYESDGGEYLLGYAWKHWRDGTFLEMVDPTIRESCLRNEVMRCIHTALLCVQEDVGDRPTMSKVVLMLNSHSVTMPMPSKPAFFIASGMAPDATTGADSQTSELNQHTAELG